MKKRRLAIAALGAGLAFSGCASIMNGGPDPVPPDEQHSAITRYRRGYQYVPVYTEPEGATCNSGNQRITTPDLIELSRNESHTIVCRKEGYETFTVFVGSRESGWLWGNILLGFVGIIYDFATKNAFVLTPEKIKIPLRPNRA